MEYLGDSSCVKAAGYKAGYLCIQFQDDSIYTYEGVDASTWRSLKMSSSKGYAFNKMIRNNYSFSEGPPPEDGVLKYIDSKYFEDYTSD
jgi:hypothetical protein